MKHNYNLELGGILGLYLAWKKPSTKKPITTIEEIALYSYDLGFKVCASGQDYKAMRLEMQKIFEGKK